MSEEETGIVESKVVSGLALARIPGFPTVAEVDLMRGIAKEFVRSGLLPKSYEENPASVFLVLQQGRELGLAPMQAINGIHVIMGKVAMSAQLMGALIIKSGKGNFRVETLTKDLCQMEFIRDGLSHDVSYTREEASGALLLNKKGDMWNKYPKDMLYNRCMSRGSRRIFPDILGGFHTPEELEDDGDGGVLQIESKAYDTSGAVVHDSLPVKAEPYEAPTEARDIMAAYYALGYTSEQLCSYALSMSVEVITIEGWEKLSRALKDQNEENERPNNNPEVSYLEQLLPDKGFAVAEVGSWNLEDIIIAATTKDALFTIAEKHEKFIEGLKEYPDIDQVITDAFETAKNRIEGDKDDK